MTVSAAITAPIPCSSCSPSAVTTLRERRRERWRAARPAIAWTAARSRPRWASRSSPPPAWARRRRRACSATRPARDATDPPVPLAPVRDHRRAAHLAPRPAAARRPRPDAVARLMRRLAGAHELLDGPLDDEAALHGNLRDLRRINRWLGGTAASRHALDRLLAGRTVPHTMLDVGTGGADIPLSLLEHAARSGRLRVTGVDSRQEVLDAARATTRGSTARRTWSSSRPTGGACRSPTARSTSSMPRSSSITSSHRSARVPARGRPGRAARAS